MRGRFVGERRVRSGRVEHEVGAIQLIELRARFWVAGGERAHFARLVPVGLHDQLFIGRWGHLKSLTRLRSRQAVPRFRFRGRSLRCHLIYIIGHETSV